MMNRVGTGDAALCRSSAVTDEKQIGFGFMAMRAVLFFFLKFPQ